jgi:hypothetical protein
VGQERTATSEPYHQSHLPPTRLRVGESAPQHARANLSSCPRSDQNTGLAGYGSNRGRRVKVCELVIHVRLVRLSVLNASRTGRAGQRAPYLHRSHCNWLRRARETAQHELAFVGQAHIRDLLLLGALISCRHAKVVWGRVFMEAPEEYDFEVGRRDGEVPKVISGSMQAN